MTTQTMKDELTLDQLDDVSGGSFSEWAAEKVQEIQDWLEREMSSEMSGFKPLPDGSGDYKPGRSF